MSELSQVQSESDRDGNVRAAIFCVLSAMLIIGVIDNYVATIAQEAGLWQFHAMRTTLALPLLVFAAVVGWGRLRPQRWWAVLLRSVLSATSMIFYFGSLGMMPIAQALAGLFSAPIWVLLLSVLVLGERIGPVRSGAILLGFAGVLLVLQPDPSDFGISFVFPMMAGFAYALTGLVTRNICTDEDPLSLLAGNFLMLGLIGCVGLWLYQGQDAGFLTRGWTPMTPTLWFWISVQAVGALLGVYLLIRAYLLAATTIVATFEFAIMIFGPAYAWIVLGQPLGPLAILGLVAIICAAVLITRRSAQ